MVVKYNTVSLRHKHSPETLFIHINQCIHIVLAFTSNARQLIIHFKAFLSTKISFLKISFLKISFLKISFFFSKILSHFILFDFSKFFFFRKYCSQLTGQRYCSLIIFTDYCSWINVHELLFMDQCSRITIGHNTKIVLQPWTKISKKSAEKSPKYLFSVGLEKKNAWKIRLPEKSVENRVYRRFFAEKSEVSDMSVEKLGVSSTRCKAR